MTNIGLEHSSCHWCQVNGSIDIIVTYLGRKLEHHRIIGGFQNVHYVVASACGVLHLVIEGTPFGLILKFRKVY
jgi:hypothetical protein